jgi:1,4-dihydroxy-2-naphthoate octaprenyltransferase
MKKAINDTLDMIFSRRRAENILAVVLFYFLGVGIGKYLGQNLDWNIIFLGLSTLLLLLFANLFFRDYFDPFPVVSDGNRNSNRNTGIARRQKYLSAGLTTLAVCSLPVYFLLVNRQLSITSIFFIALAFVLILAYSIPPVILVKKGYGELILTLWIAILTPALGYLLQSTTIHPLVPLITVPLAFVYLAMLISTDLKDFLNEMITSQKTLTQMVGWKFAMNLHNGLVAAAFLLIAGGSFLGLPWNLIWPMLLPLPVFIFTIYEIQRIKSGAKPRWALLTLTGYAGTGCMLYVLLFTLWVR